MTYTVYGAWWNGHSYETVCKDADTQKQALGAASLLLRECNPRQIWIIDQDNKEPIPDDLETVASSLNKEYDGEGIQHTLDVIA